MSSNEMPVEQARKVLGDLVASAQLAGVTTIITRYGRPAAMLVPIPQETTVPTITLVSAVTGDAISGTELGDPESRVEFHELPKAAQGWAREQGYGTDESELVYVLDAGEAIPAGFPVFVVEQATTTTTIYKRTTDEGTDTIIITVTGDEVERSFLTDGVLTGGPDHDTADRLHDYLVDITADGYREA